jgi:tetratricopeptide (TPR) repeat protein
LFLFKRQPLVHLPGKSRCHAACVFPCVLFITLLSLQADALTRITINPLVNKSGNKVYEWISAAVPESFFRKAEGLSGFQVWEPTFLFGADSTGWTMESDSLLKLNWNRWGWDASCGGSYSVSNEVIAVELKVYTVKNGRVFRKKLDAKGDLKSIEQLCSGLFVQFLESADYPLSTAQRQSIARPFAASFDAYATYVAGYGFEMRRNYSAAITAYSRALEIDPGLSRALCRIGKLFASAGALDSARKFFDRCALNSPGNPVIAADVADFYAQHELPEKALKFLQANRPLLDQTATGMKAIGVSLLLTGELQRAIAILNRALAQGPPDLETDFVLGRAYLSAGEFSKASDVFNRLVRYRPDCLRYYALLGTAYRSSGRLMESARVLENAGKLEDGNVTVLINLAQTYFEIGWLNDAEQLLLRAQEKEPDAVEISVNLGVVYWRMGKRDQAAALFARAGKLGKHLQSVYNNQGNILFLSGDAEKAIDWYLKAEKTGKKNEVVLFNLALAYLSINKLGKAASYFEEVQRMSPDRLDVLIQLADIAEKRKKNSDAELYNRKILELSPHNEHALVQLLNIMIKKGQYKEALEPLESYLNDFPNNEKMALMQADLYNRMGWYEVSAMKYQLIVRDFPDSWEGYFGLGKNMFDAVRYKNGRDYDKAIYYLKTAADLNRTDPEPEYIIGTIYMDYKHFRELALDNWKSALTKATDPAMIKSIKDLIAKAQQ